MKYECRIEIHETNSAERELSALLVNADKSRLIPGVLSLIENMMDDDSGSE